MRLSGVRRGTGYTVGRGVEPLNAELARAEAWRKELRNPVTYDTLKHLGIDLRGLKFKPIPLPQPATMGGERRMTIAEAKKALAVTFGVQPEDVEITIRG